MALERAKGGTAANVAGEAVFKMKKDDDGRWRVIEESLRKLPGEPLVPVRRKIGLFLMG